MAELPEIAKLAGQMRDALCGKTVQAVTLLQEKCANISPGEFQKRVAGAKIGGISYKGKWIITTLSNSENILLSLGMGADILFFENDDRESDKYQAKLVFTDGSGYTARFWWFGKFLLVSKSELSLEPSLINIALDPFDKKFTLEYFMSLIKDKKAQVKAFLMNQGNIGGIGNMYVHDILFKARLHPQRKISDMDEGDIKLLFRSMMEILNLSRENGSFAYESDFFGQKGGFTMDYFLVGYKENKPCPVCSETIVLIKTGSTSSYICPVCQRI